MKTQDEKKLFYARCAELLNIEHDFRVPVPRRTRWNTRLLGNGRYPGFGLIQCYGDSVRVVSRHGTRWFDSYEAAYEYLQIVFDTTVNT